MKHATLIAIREILNDYNGQFSIYPARMEIDIFILLDQERQVPQATRDALAKLGFTIRQSHFMPPSAALALDAPLPPGTGEGDAAS